MNTPPPFPPETTDALPAEFEAPAATLVMRRRTLLWRDRAFQLLLISTLVVNLALFGYLALRFATLPDLLPLHFDSLGLPDRIDTKSGAFALPIIGIVVFALNAGLGILMHRRERAAAILLTVGTLFVQMLMWLAVINIAGIV